VGVTTGVKLTACVSAQEEQPQHLPGVSFVSGSVRHCSSRTARDLRASGVLPSLRALTQACQTSTLEQRLRIVPQLSLELKQRYLLWESEKKNKLTIFRLVSKVTAIATSNDDLLLKFRKSSTTGLLLL
jgi:hypothetical protein